MSVRPVPPLSGASSARRVPPSSPPASLRWLPLLVVLAMVCEWVAEVLNARSTILNPDGSVEIVGRETAFYYGTHGAAILFGLVATAIAAWNGAWRCLPRLSRLAMGVLLVHNALSALATYAGPALLSKRLFGATGPFVWILCGLVLAGVYRSVWRVLVPVVRILCLVTAVLALVSMYATETYTRALGPSATVLYVLILAWLGGWLFLVSASDRRWRLALALVPYATLVMCAIFLQARSWILFAMGLLPVCLVVMLRLQAGGTAGIPRVLAVLVGVAAMAVLLQGMTSFHLREAGEGLVHRMADDTRTGQYALFFRQVPWHQLLLGGGPESWYDFGPGREHFQFFDNGYVWMLFIGGLPTLLGYGILVLWPAFRLLARKPVGVDAACALMLVLWSLSLTGLSTFALPAISTYGFLTSLMAGRCYDRLASSSSRASLP